ncbi:DUF1127 domain-containing protein [Marinibaculum pumilum]|uniref:DUF1127 domain-containing protein n=1 Tax=Marinibaculum pumilum TaxID=1766165 RepID=A0ABV7KZY6_9PROT
MGSQDFSAQIAAARLIRAQAAADFMSAAFAALGLIIRPVTAPLARPVARWRELSRLRATFAALDDATLRDLNIPREMASEITPEALADHPLAAGDRWRVANENAVAGSRARSAA